MSRKNLAFYVKCTATLSLTAMLILLLPVLASASSATEEDWPMLLHDPRHTGFTSSPVPETPGERWSYTTGDLILAQPSAAQGMVFVPSLDNHVYALDWESGELIWSFEMDDVAASTPAVAGDSLIACSYSGKVYSLSLSDGSLNWEVDLGDMIAYSSPCVVDDVVFVGTGDGVIYALDRYTGATIWSFSTGDAILDSPAVGYGKVFVASNDGYLYALDEDSGSFLWRFEVSDGKYYVLSSPVVDDNKVFIGSAAYKKIYALAQSTGALIWEFTVDDYVWSSPTVADGVVYATSHDGKIYALDEDTGEQLWVSEVEGTPPSVISAGGVILAVTNEGRLYALNRSDGSLLWDMSFEGGTMAPPVVADKRIYVCFNDTIYALVSVSTLTLTLSESSTTVGGSITIEGTLTPPQAGASVTIQVREVGGSWSTLTSVTTDQEGRFTYSWTPQAEGSFELRAVWSGDPYTLACESSVSSLEVEAAPPLFTTEVLIGIAVACCVAVAGAAVYLKKRPKKPKPHALRVTASPTEVYADGQSTSTITVELVDSKGKPLQSEEDREIALSATSGSIASTIVMKKGESSATATLTASTDIGVSRVTASSKGLKSGEVTVTFKEKKRYCMHCGERMPLDAKVCPSCGRAPPSGVDVKVCPNCGAIIPEVAKFCRDCGARQPESSS